MRVAVHLRFHCGRRCRGFLGNQRSTWWIVTPLEEKSGEKDIPAEGKILIGLADLRNLSSKTGV